MMNDRSHLVLMNGRNLTPLACLECGAFDGYYGTFGTQHWCDACAQKFYQDIPKFSSEPTLVEDSPHA